MAFQFLSLTFLLTLFILSPHSTLSQNSPAPSSQPPADGPSLSSSPSPNPSLFSPPAPPPSDLAPISPPPVEEKSPSPVPVVASDVNHENQSNAGDLERNGGKSGGMSGGQKAGVAIGVIAGVCVVGVGALMYKKRQDNIHRSQYAYSARREFM